MTLQPLTDLGVAQWLTATDTPWHVLATQGPPGFATYTTVWFDGEDADPYLSDDALMSIVVDLAATHTARPDEVVVGLWDGWGDLYEEGHVRLAARAGWLNRLPYQPTPPRIGAAFNDEIMNGPRFDLDGRRAYLLFTGPVTEVGRWPTEPVQVDVPRDLPPAALTWPADHAWFIAADVDRDWLCVAGDAALAAALAVDPRLTTAPAVYGTPPTSRPA